MRIVIDIFLVIGLYFALAGTIGIIKMPDVFSRMQASTCVATLGMLCIAIAGILYAAFYMHNAGAAIKIAVIGLMVMVTNPIGSHVLARGAYKAGIRPEQKMEVDELGRDFDE
ncbi:MAG: monovalent cation/H(+) antiporter subunit G [Oscillospiraceae bacterium]|nr:monovalent cation/H(+) antiporter subunit G [Oscillospiraceae bacterium]